MKESHHICPNRDEALKLIQGWAQNATFFDDGIHIEITRARVWHVVRALVDGSEVWYTSSFWSWSDHYGIEVDPWYRWLWIGHKIADVKDQLDWVLQRERASMYSRMIFLIRRWYVPVSISQETLSPKRKIKKSELDELMVVLRDFYHDTDPDKHDDIGKVQYPETIHFRHSPDRAKILGDQIKTV